VPTDRSAADDLLVVALASGKTLKDAAQTAGVSLTTAKNRNRDAGFKRRVRAARGALLQEATGKLVSGLGAAVLVLQQLLVDDDPGIRLKAADKLLSHSFRAAELVDLEQRVQELERAAGGEEADDDDGDDEFEGDDTGGDDGGAEDAG
jgi:hypothetical protein